MSVPQTPARVGALDGLRGLACLGVLVYHSAAVTSALQLNSVGRLIARFDVALAIFFAISGYVLYRPLVAAQITGRPMRSKRSFWLRRVVRIVPAYWVALSVCLLIPYVRDSWDALRLVQTGDLWRYFAFAQVYEARTAALGFGHAWTLCVDAAFYVSLPLYAQLSRRFGTGRQRLAKELPVLGVIGLASFIARVWTHVDGDDYPFYVTLAGTALWVVAGMALAVLSVCAADHALLRQARDRPQRFFAAAAIGFLALSSIGLPRTLALPFTDVQWGVVYVSYIVVTMLLLIPIAAMNRRPGGVAGALATRPIAWLGTISYGIYLWHLPMLLVMRRLGVVSDFPGSPFLALTVTTAVSAVGLGAVSYYALERPLMRRLDRGPTIRPDSAPLEPALTEPAP